MGLFLAVHSHSREDCPAGKPETMKAMAQLISEDNARRAGVRIHGAYMNCPTPSTPGTHIAYFIVEASSADTVSSYLKLPAPGGVKIEQIWSIPDQLRQMMGR